MTTTLRTRLAALGFWPVVMLLAVVLLGVATVLRFSQTLGTVTNLTDQFPWGLWVGFKLSAIALAGGGFTLMAVVHLFNLKQFEPIVRPTVLMAFLSYQMFVIALLFDLGQPWRIWHTTIFWNPHSVMFEVAWCVMLYTTVLSLEFAPVVFERLRLTRLRKLLHVVTTPLVIAGVILSTLHQSSLGSLYLIVPEKLHPLWYSPLIPLLFFLSAVGAGLGMVILQSHLSARAFGLTLRMEIVEPLARGMVVVLGLYGVLRISAIRRSGALGGLLHPGYEQWLFLLEFALGVVLPIALLVQPRVRHSRTGLVVASFLAVLGVILNRMNVAVTGMERAAGVRYSPSLVEWAVFVGLIGLGFALFTAAVRLLPIYPELQEPAQA
jgi:Ni/Fe-hydrogenase subunit HybB-like protein